MSELSTQIGLDEVSELVNNPIAFSDLVSALYTDFDKDNNGKIDFNEGEELVKTINFEMSKNGTHKNCKPFTNA